MYDHIGVARFERTGRLVSHGEADRLGRPDAVEFQGRAGERLVDWMAHVHVWFDRWPTRAGAAAILEREGDGWKLLATAMPFDGIYVRAETEEQLTFSVYVPLRAGRTYRLHLPGAVLTRNTIRLAAILREPGQDQGVRLRTREPKPATATRRAS